ncbi:insulinase family protein [Sporolactobacillus sp. THM7-4]|nr:insulinase family protein [Sporolactobacillus sp. THM7-4]
MSHFKQNAIVHGFKLVHTDEVHEINSRAYLFEHVRSGARLLYLQNDDDNKVFSISFRTPPEDNTGVFHILEHSVLCGSEKYPVKEPFVELLKGSLSTFLNAFTFSDKTMYPVASRNEKDFLNLIGVYMDAVFHPDIYKYKEILEQEGWHYELNSPDDEIKYKGVVYNEMKGAFSSPEGLLQRTNQNSLFPDTAYGFESGGDPLEIPELTYEHFIDSHKKYYSPSNSYIYLYGNMDIDEKLDFLDKAYLSTYDRVDVDSEISVQKPIGHSTEVVKEYPISASADEEDKTYLSLNFAVSRSTDAELYLAFDILKYILLDSPAAPLKKAVLDAGIGQDVFGTFDNSILQPYFSINVKNASEDKKEPFKKIVFDTLTQLVRDGINKRQIEAAINVKEFNLREADYGYMPKGLIYSIMAMDSWLYDENPLIHLKFEGTLERIKQALTNHYFENLIKNYLLDSDHQTLVMIKPSKTIADEESEKIAERLSRFKQSLNAEELSRLVESTQKLKERQASEDRPEDLRKLPMLSIEDIDKKAEQLPLTETNIGDVKTLFHELSTNKIAYISLYFDASSIPSDQIPYLALLEEVMGKVDTEKYKYSDLVNEINIQTGGIDFENDTFSDKENDDRYQPKFAVRVKTLVSKLPESLNLIDEILNRSKFDSESRIKEIIKEIKSRLEMSFNQNGQSVVLRRLGSYMSQASQYTEQLKGLGFYRFIGELDKNLADRFNETAQILKRITDQLFIKEGLTVSVTGDEDILQAFSDHFKELDIPSRPRHNARVSGSGTLVAPSKNEGLMTSSKVQYVAKGANFKSLGFPYTGKLHVLKQILTLDYLWNQVRVMGGAYGCGVSLKSSGNFIFWSYRDPNLDETLTVYDKAGDYAKSFAADDYEMTKYIIGTISSLEAPLTPRDKGEQSDAEYFRNVTQADIQRIREEVLSTRKEDINQFAGLLKAVTDQNLICVLGNETMITQNKDLFEECVNVFE